MMVIVKLMGGLGNQMFQYAAARSFSKSKKVYIDFSFLNNNKLSNNIFTARSFELKIFSKLKVGRFSKFFLNLINSNRAIAKFLSPKYLIINDKNVFNDDVKTIQNFYLDGYFQNPIIFQDLRTVLLKELTFPALCGIAKKIEMKISTSENSVAIHVRRGDYLKPEINAIHGVLTMEYYIESIAIINNKITKPFFYIFSDDAIWCEANFSFLDSKEVISGKNLAWVDMCLMSKCKHQIIANSSFSWWGAWLNNNPKKIVIAPKKWFNQMPTDIIPNEWITL